MTRTVRSLRELVDAGAGELRWADGGARENPRREASLLLQAVVGLDRAQLIVRGDHSPGPGEEARYWDMVRRRARGLPLQLLLGQTGFHDVTLSVEPGVFIPRPETELLVEHAGEEIERALAGEGVVRALDLCTGSGAVAVALAWRFRDEPRVRVYAGDWSPRAVRLARRNAERNAVHVDVRRSDLFSALADLETDVDVIVANPPYISRAERDALPVEVRLGDPEDALFDPDGGTGFHRRIARRGCDFLRPGGLLVVEIGQQQGAEVEAAFRELGYEDTGVLVDLAGRDRVVRGRRPTSTPSS